MDIQTVKQRFSLIGNSVGLNRAVETAVQVAPTDLSVLITGESGVGKETLPQIIHAYSSRKHGKYIAVNCGAIPEGTMDSELFGHVKGSFTGASSERKGYFEEADAGTIFLDEVAEMPLQTQVKLLRVLENGEFIKVGSSKVQKTDVRVVAATNVKVLDAIKKGKFREDLFYRLNTVPIQLPPLRERGEDINLLFRKFAYDFAEKYRMPGIRLDEDAQHLLRTYNWPGNIRQLKNVTEQLSILEHERLITADRLRPYLVNYTDQTLPAISENFSEGNAENMSEREILYKVIFDMRKEMNEMKAVIGQMMQGKTASSSSVNFENEESLVPSTLPHSPVNEYPQPTVYSATIDSDNNFDDAQEIEESLSLEDQEKDLIVRALEKHRGKRKYAAQDLGISERTLYRKIKEFNLGK